MSRRPVVGGRRCDWAALTCAALLGVAGAANGQSVPPGSTRGESVPPEAQKTEDVREERRRMERWKRQAAEIKIAVRGEGTTATSLSLKPDPVLRWTNPVRSECDGLVFLWTDGGRPAAISDFYRMRIGGRLVESHFFVSLSPGGLSATRGGKTEWEPKDAGITLRPIQGAPRPSTSLAERLRQMRTLAREFSAFVDREKGRTELRLLSQPIFRNEPHAKGNTGDGALFAFVLGTDPEVLLLIDDRPGPDGAAWNYAFARISTHSLRAEHRAGVVWEVPQDHPGQGDSPSKPYFTVKDDSPSP